MLKAGDLARQEDHQVKGVKSGRTPGDRGISHVWHNIVIPGYKHDNDIPLLIFMSPPEGLGDILFFPGRLSVCLSRIVSAL